MYSNFFMVNVTFEKPQSTNCFIAMLEKCKSRSGKENPFGNFLTDLGTVCDGLSLQLLLAKLAEYDILLLKV